MPVRVEILFLLILFTDFMVHIPGLIGTSAYVGNSNIE